MEVVRSCRLILTGVLLVIASPARAVTHYVAMASTNPVPPYTTWDTAATNIQDAIDAANPNSTVLVSNGVYATGGRIAADGSSNRVVITKNMTVSSVNGPAVTSIEGVGGFGVTFSDVYSYGVDPYSNAVRCVYLERDAVLSGFTLSNGLARTNGGGAWCDSSAMLSNCVVVDCAAQSKGGGVFCGTVLGCALLHNFALGSGGGASDAALAGCTLRENAAAAGGGASQSVLNECILSSNSSYHQSWDSAYGSGGGAYLCAISNSVLAENSALYGGGAYGCVLAACVLSNNAAVEGFSQFTPVGGGGGGAYTSVLNNCTIIGNQAAYGAGAAGGSLDGCTVAVNRASGVGGGGYSATASNCLFAGNHAASGGAMYSGAGENCSLLGNRADNYGGGIYQGTLRNCAVSGCKATFGGGTYQATLTSCTLAGNSASFGGGSRGGNLINCIVYFNTADLGPNYDGGSLRYCCTTPFTNGTGNIAGDPLLADFAHVSAGSPCIGAGSATNTSGTDMDGETWNIPPAIGCDEPWVGAATGVLSVGIAALHTNLTAGFAAEFRAVISGHATSSFWTFSDGATVSNRPVVTHAFVATGDYSVVLWAFNDTHPSGVAATVTVHVTAGEHFVRQDNPSPVFPYSSWATAATNIQDAVDTAVAGALILVSNGVYDTGGRVVEDGSISRVAITRPAIVRSVNGPAFTRIRGQKANTSEVVRCVYLGANARLDGFTLADGGTTNAAGGGAWCEPLAVLSNCVISGNSAGLLGGGVYRGQLDDCVLSQNYSSGDGGGSAYSVLNRCTVSGNTASVSAYGQGGGTYWSVLAGCQIVSNVAASGGGAFGGVLRNCVLKNNKAQDWNSLVFVGGFIACAGSCDFTTGGGGADLATLDGCTLVGNSALTRGGGADGSTLKNCLIVSNTAPYGAGSFNNTIYNSLLAANAAQYGGGARYGTLVNCTVVGNTASNMSGGAEYATLRNSIIYFNHAPMGANYTSGTVTYCCSTPFTNAEGNITGDPMFVNVAAGNFRLTAASPCLDAGTNSYVQGSTDLDGAPRIAFGVVDMGAYELQTPAGYWRWVSAITNGLTNLTDSAAGDGYPNLLKYATGSSPTNCDGLASTIGAHTSNGLFSLRFNRNTNANDITLIAEGSYSATNDASWSGLATNINGSWGGATNVSESGAGLPVTVTVNDMTMSATNRFLRLRVTRP